MSIPSNHQKLTNAKGGFRCDLSLSQSHTKTFASLKSAKLYFSAKTQ